MARRKIILSLIIGLSGLASVPQAAANTAPTKVGSYSDWTVYTRGTGQGRICYALTEPTAKAPQTVRHGDIYFLVSNWASGAASEQPSLLTGFPVKTTRAPKARVGRTSITMYGAGNEAFIADSADERELVSKMRAGASMTVEAVSSRGTEVSYNFSLKGVTAALREARRRCS